MKEIVVISGKGGTGKTSIAASLAILARQAVVCDCDVDAADLHLILTPRVRERHDFFSGREAIIHQESCTSCGLCRELCRFEAVTETENDNGEVTYAIEPLLCDGCGVCVHFCPPQAIDFPERKVGEWFVSECRVGPMVHARLGIAAGNSGKLVSVVRDAAKRMAEKEHLNVIIVDGPPGIGCPVIASITGATHVLIVTEPTLSAAHDLERVLALARQFQILPYVCINKWNVNEEGTEMIEKRAKELGARLLGRIRHDPAVTLAQVQGKTIVELEAESASEIRAIWEEISY